MQKGAWRRAQNSQTKNLKKNPELVQENKKNLVSMKKR
jgi:hypothetical protein